LEQTIDERIQNPSQDSYVSGLYQEGIQRIAQKVGEEAVETVLEMNDASGERLLSESADLIFHLLLLLKAKGFGLEDVVNMLQHRAE
jgi:phosphoribosyl-ATP pyrophosphohydrolase/phosphoribosyl-AMP cyclohydrolase